MAVTYGDIIYELENYQYSSEYMDLLKENLEIKLMAKYIENQEFMMNNSDTFMESYSIEDGYFPQIDSYDTIEVIEEKFWGKVGGAIKWIGKRLKNAFLAAINFFNENRKKLCNYITGNKEKTKDTLKVIELGGTKDTDNYITKSLLEIVDKAWDRKWTSEGYRPLGASIQNLRSEYGKQLIKYCGKNNSVKAACGSSLYEMLVFADPESLTKTVIVPSDDKKIPIDYSDLELIMLKISNRDLNGAHELYIKTVEKNKRYGLHLKGLDTTNNNELARKLQASYDRFSKIITDASALEKLVSDYDDDDALDKVAKKNKYNDSGVREEYSELANDKSVVNGTGTSGDIKKAAANSEKFAKFNSQLTASLAEIMKVYSRYLEYINKVRMGLDKIGLEIKRIEASHETNSSDNKNSRSYETNDYDGDDAWDNASKRGYDARKDIADGYDGYGKSPSKKSSSGSKKRSSDYDGDDAWDNASKRGYDARKDIADEYGKSPSKK